MSISCWNVSIIVILFCPAHIPIHTSSNSFVCAVKCLHKCSLNLWRVFWRQGVTFHSFFKGAKETKRGRRSSQGPALEMEVYFLELHDASEYRYARLSKSQCHARNSNGMRKQMLSLYQSFPMNGFMTLQWGDFPPQSQPRQGEGT